MNMDAILDLNLHDSVITRIEIPRAGNRHDTVALYVEYIEDYETMRTSNKVLEFSDCYSFRADLHFGVNSPDSILRATVVASSELLETVKKGLERLPGKQIPSQLKHCCIETSTTGSTIDVVASGFNIREAGQSG